ncbi:hypothetical protein C6503_25110 [Candidatus Poribacteria bacterium]|nr:MAG: hypothetical protein C6503_25110 [Candidatus Poribacteria bacterium]
MYSVSVTASDGKLTAIIAVTINVTDVEELPAVTEIEEEVPTNSTPVFIEGASTTRNVAEDTSIGVDIGTPVAATDADGHTLTYRLGGTDAAAFTIDGTTGQLRANTSLDYETKSSYTVTITVSDGTLTDSITVTINVTDVNETPANNAPEFTEDTSATRAVTENTVVDETPANNAPIFTDGSSTTRSAAENTAAGTNIGKDFYISLLIVRCFGVLAEQALFLIMRLAFDANRLTSLSIQRVVLDSV